MTERRVTMSYSDKSGALPGEALSWQRILEEEPMLKELRRELKRVKDDGSAPSFCANAVWFGYRLNRPAERSPRDKVRALAGWSARNPTLRSQSAYTIAYEKLYALLPDCRDCSCA